MGLFCELGHPVLTVSLRGHRPSQGKVPFQTLGRSIRDTHAPVEALGLADEQVVYIGHSMGGIVGQGVLARSPRTAGVVIVDWVAFHHALSTYLPVMRQWFRRHPRTALAAIGSPAKLFGSDPLVRALVLGEDASVALVTALRPHLGGEKAAATSTMLAAKVRGRQPLDGRKRLFISAWQSAFSPPARIEASAREYRARYVEVDGPPTLRMAPSSALPAAQALAACSASLPTSVPPSA